MAINEADPILTTPSGLLFGDSVLEISPYILQ